MTTDQDPTRIDLTTVDPYTDPFRRRMVGRAVHGNTPFSVPFISHVGGNLYQGGCEDGLVLPERFRHVISLYPWERYLIRHEGVSYREVKMYDSNEGPDRANVVELATLVRESCEDGPTLVHCQAGLNRSGLIAGAALVLGGHSPEAAIRLLRENRSPAVLCNQAFHDWLLEFRPEDDA